MTIDEMVVRAQGRIRKHINNLADYLDRAAEFQKTNPGYSFVLLRVEDRTQFYRIVNHMNKTYGKGSQFWSVQGRVLRFVDPVKKSYSPPIHRYFYVTQKGVDLSYLQQM